MNGRKRRSLLLGAAFVSGLALWTASVVLLGVSEPWDSPRYWIACLTALFLSALFGCLIGRRAWVAGVLVVCAQLPVMLVSAGAGPLMTVGMVLLAIGSVPAAIITALASAIVQKRQGRKTGRRLGSR